MASPFRLFRKHQKAFLAIAAVLAMVIFVLGDLLMSMVGGNSPGSGGSQNVTTWDGGKMTAAELESLTQRRYFVSQFLTNLTALAAQSIQNEGGSPIRPNLPDFRLPEGTSVFAVQNDCVSQRIFAQQAEKVGIQVGDKAINYFLKEWGLGRMGDREIREILKTMRGDNLRYHEQQLFAGIRELLLSYIYNSNLQASALSLLPEQRWVDWLRINELISIEAAVLPTASFLEKAPEPTEAQLTAFYEENKDWVSGRPDPEVPDKQLISPRPGFREPRRVRLQYLYGDLDAWTQKLLDTVTEEEISEFYETNKGALFVKEPASSFDSLFENDSENDELNPDEPEVEIEEENTTTQPADPSSEEPAESEDESPRADEVEPESPAAEQPSEENSGSTNSMNPFRLAAFQDLEAAEGDADATPESEESTDASEAAEAETSDEATPSDAEASIGDPIEEELEGEKEPEYMPLDEVSDQIRRQLASSKAEVELQKIVDGLSARLHSAFNPYGVAVIKAESEGSETPAPPAILADFNALAAESGLAAKETVLLDQFELLKTEVGKAIDEQSRREVVAQAAFGRLTLYEPFIARGQLDGSWYIVEKVEDVPTRVPEFSEIRDSVVNAWKENEASRLALQAAEQFATEAKQAGGDLKAFFSGKDFEVETTDLFSWLTFGTTPTEMQRGPRVGDAPPLESIDEAFMETAFALQGGDVAAVLNHDHTSAYVVKLQRRERTKAELHNAFLQEANSWYGGQMMAQMRIQQNIAKISEEVEERVDLDRESLNEFLSPRTDN